MRYVLYSHIGSGNRGCEATARSLHDILAVTKKDFYIFSEDKEEEKKCGTEGYASVLYTPIIEGIRPVKSIIPRLVTKFGIDTVGSTRFRYKGLFNIIQEKDVGLSTGGDVFCYNQKLADKIGFLTSEMKKKGAVTCLMACSIEEKKLTEKTLDILRQFNYIFPRESLTEKNLRKYGFQNLHLYPDPAFMLRKDKVEGVEFLENHDYIGINYSNYTNHGDSDGERYNTIIRFIENILKNTEMNVILIPHVFWKDENDMDLLKRIKQKFCNEDRVKIVKEAYNSAQLKYIISKCRFFLGSRTHSVIAAYSAGVPTLALGYSIKSKGIAVDIFGEHENYVYDSNNLSDYESFSKSFEYILNHETEIRDTLKLKQAEFVAALETQAEFLKKLG